MMATTLESKRIPQLEADQRPGSYGILNSHSTTDILSAVSTWNSQRILLVHSKTLAIYTSHITDLKTALGPLVVATKSSVGAHSPYADIIEIAHILTSQDIDCLVCVGSGSYSDACKTARLLAATLPAPFDAADIEALIDPKKGLAPESAIKKNEKVKLILVPTSLSAGEWNFAASCTNPKGKKQHFALKDGCAPDLVLMDPWLARSTPQQLWLSSGVRAIDHCIEILCNPKCAEHPDAQVWATEALRDLVKGLLEYKRGLNQGKEADMVEGVSKCQAGSRMALMGFIVHRIPMGPSHAIGHQLGSAAGVMHGITSCIMLPAVLRFTKPVSSEAQKKIVQTFNEAWGWKVIEAADCVEMLVAILGLPSRMSEVGVTENDQIERIIDLSMTDMLVSFGGFLGRDDIAKIVYSVR